MNITDPTLPIIFCEGKSTSLDYALLKEMRVAATGNIIPIGGKTGALRFIEGYLEGNSPRRYLVFRDRDFDLDPPAEANLLMLPKSQERIFLSYRTCIENYLLDAVLLDQYYQNYQDSSRWKFGPSPGRAAFDNWIQEAAQAMIAYQATRWALSDIKPSDGWIGFANTWTKRNDELPASLEEAECLRQATALLDHFRAQAQCASQTVFQERYDAHLARFKQVDFWSKQRHLIFFSGKDMANMMQRNHPSRLPPLEGFFKWAVKRLEWQSHPDLVALAAKLSD